MIDGHSHPSDRIYDCINLTHARIETTCALVYTDASDVECRVTVGPRGVAQEPSQVKSFLQRHLDAPFMDDYLGEAAKQLRTKVDDAGLQAFASMGLGAAAPAGVQSVPAGVHLLPAPGPGPSVDG